MNDNKIEILAPSGGPDSVKAAVRCGADAIYLGSKEFSARASAKNFDDAELETTVQYCHRRGVKVYLTVNTIVFDSELAAVEALVRTACKVGVDALIVQNIGVASLIRGIAPDLPLHGSTQMTVHTLSGAKMLYEMGFKRVVLAREMTKEEIREIADNCPIELEIFVHGALCMSMSGQCYMSAMLGSRSGNRGACAQSCRLPFSVGKSRKKCNCHALSLKDNSIISYLSEMQAMGVASAKIEGRMKRPEYVACAVKACAESRDTGGVSAETAALLKGVFSRTGFTDGYYADNRGKPMFGTRLKEDVISADEKLLSKIRGLYKNERQSIAVDFDFTAEIGKKPVLSVSDGINSVTITGESACEKALNKPVTCQKCTEQLKKTGATQYFAGNIRCNLQQDVTLPLSAINALRRNALEKLDEKRGAIPERRLMPLTSGFSAPDRKSPPRLRARASTARLGKAFSEFDTVFVPLFSPDEDILKLIENGVSVGAEIPAAMFSMDSAIEKRLAEVKMLGVTDVYCQNIGAVYLAKQAEMTIHGGFRLNFTNTRDILWAEKFGFADTELSLEITLRQIKSLGGSLPVGIVSYGYLPLMLTRNCPNKSAGISCQDCKGHGEMQDRKGKKFILTCGKTATEVLNCVPLKLCDKLEELKNISFHTYYFTVENYVESVEKISEIHSNFLFLKDFTRGLYFRGVN